MKLNVLTVLPASLLCLFMADRASGLFSRASANSRDTMLPNSTSSLQPPHFQPSPGEPLWRVSQPQMVAEPSAQDLVTAKATPAEAMAWTKADSLVAVKERNQWIVASEGTTRGFDQPCEHLLSRAWQKVKKLSFSLWSCLDLLQRHFLVLGNKLLCRQD